MKIEQLKKEIREELEELKEGEKDNADMGSYRLASKYRDWAEALKWVLKKLEDET